ncbi:receptor-like protein 19 [Humulus lupulus]|uniref:receptor-like protein 19 n=1 Tax=Humulus lupulus TaxID=3486 RepID=UPI002B403A1A|nr:receptor-like protein 19 [Humulus lupulus]
MKLEKSINGVAPRAKMNQQRSRRFKTTKDAAEEVLTNEQFLCPYSFGVSGEILSTFENLRSLEQLWASDNEFTGKIPYFIGSWSNLTNMVLQGNYFQGPIPSTFVNLTYLVQFLSSMEAMQNVLELLSDMLQAVNPLDSAAVKDEVIVELVNRCRTNKKKLM